MRSRFAAFAIGDAEYLWRTLHPDHEDRALPKDQVVQALKASARRLKFMRLAILDAKDARVLFHAAVFEKGKDRSFVELSTFAHDGVGWRYLSGEARPPGSPAPLAALTIETFAPG
jgi:SEC-C motif-containing protein